MDTVNIPEFDLKFIHEHPLTELWGYKHEGFPGTVFVWDGVTFFVVNDMVFWIYDQNSIDNTLSFHLLLNRLDRIKVLSLSQPCQQVSCRRARSWKGTLAVPWSKPIKGIFHTILHHAQQLLIWYMK